MHKHLFAAFATLALAFPAAAAFQFSVVDFPGATGTNLFAVNNRGQYVGAYLDANGSSHAIWFDGNSLRPLDPDGIIGTSPQSWAYSINTRAEIAGAYQDSSGTYHGYLWVEGKITTVEYPGGFNTQAYGVNDDREIIGVYADAQNTSHAYRMHAGVYTNIDIPGSYNTLPLSINNWFEIAGEDSTTSSASFGYVESSTGTVRTSNAPAAPPGSTFFISINNWRQTLGAYVDSNGNYDNFLITGGVYLPFNVPQSFGATYVSAQTINDLDQIVGLFYDSNSVQHGFIAVCEGAAAQDRPPCH